jgi:hypothetical protein
MRRKAKISFLMSFFAVILVTTVVFAANWWEEKQAENDLDQKKIIYRKDYPGQVESASRVKWDDQYIEVMAGGTADKKDTVNLAHAYSIATKTARHLAYDKLSETVAGINITSDATYDRELMVDSNLITEVRALIKGARVIKEEKKQMVDGSVWVEVTLGLLLNSKDGLIQPTSLWIDRQPVVEKPVLFSPSSETVKSLPEYGGGYTGLIIDAAGLKATPAMLPKIKVEDGREILGPNEVDREYMINQGLVGYADSIGKAKAMKRVGSNPLVVKAIGIEGTNKSNIVVSTNDAMKIASATSVNGFLRECRVVVVIN